MIQTLEQQFYVRELLGYQFRIEYKQGTSNKVAYALSRLLDILSKPEPVLQPITSDFVASFLTCISVLLFDLVP